MSADERAKKAQALINEVTHMPDLGYGNYKQELNEYRRILIDLLTLIRDDALSEKETVNG